MTRAVRPYAECPACGSAAVTHPNAAEGRRLYGCTRCGHAARSFARAATDPSRFDNRPRDGGRVLPIIRERD